MVYFDLHMTFCKMILNHSLNSAVKRWRSAFFTFTIPRCDPCFPTMFQGHLGFDVQIILWNRRQGRVPNLQLEQFLTSELGMV